MPEICSKERCFVEVVTLKTGLDRIEAAMVAQGIMPLSIKKAIREVIYRIFCHRNFSVQDKFIVIIDIDVMLGSFCVIP